MSDEGLFPNPESASAELLTCAQCDGMFLPEDMDGEHCRECVWELFGD